MEDIADSPAPKDNKRALLDKLRSKKVLVAIVAAVLVITAVVVVLAMHSGSPQPAQSASDSGQVVHTKQVPQLSITTPADNTETLDSAVTVTGSVTTGAVVTVNGVSTAVNKGSFSTVVTLKTGSNTITIVATNKDGKTTNTLTVTRNQPAATTPSITLTGSTMGDASGSGGKAKISLSWESNGTEVKKSYYILRSASPNPTYNGTAYATDQAGNRSYADSVPLDGAIYYYRVCEIVASKCGTYSNQLPIAAQIASSGETITITATNGAKVDWNAGGVLGNGGFLLLWSPDPTPSYPSAGTVYTKAQPNVINFTATMDHDFVSGNTYYVRVCENLGGKCGSYSDQVTVTAP